MTVLDYLQRALSGVDSGFGRDLVRQEILFAIEAWKRASSATSRADLAHDYLREMLRGRLACNFHIGNPPTADHIPGFVSTAFAVADAFLAFQKPKEPTK